jgi:hypothetical protein
VVKPEGKRPLGRQKRRWEDGIRMDLTEIGCGCVYWIRTVQNRDRTVLNAVMNLRALRRGVTYLVSLSSGVSTGWCEWQNSNVPGPVWAHWDP